MDCSLMLSPTKKNAVVKDAVFSSGSVCGQIWPHVPEAGGSTHGIHLGQIPAFMLWGSARIKPLANCNECLPLSPFRPRLLFVCKQRADSQLPAVTLT